MNITSEDIKDILIGESSLGLTFGTNLFIGKEPAGKDNCATIIDSYGLPPQLTFDRTEKYEYPSIQILVRNNDYVAGLTLCYNIKDVLHGYSNTINGTFYSVVRCSGDAAFLQWDENDRAVFSINFLIQRRE